MAKTFPFSYKLETTIIIISNKTLTKKLEKDKKKDGVKVPSVAEVLSSLLVNPNRHASEKTIIIFKKNEKFEYNCYRKKETHDVSDDDDSDDGS